MPCTDSFMLTPCTDSFPADYRHCPGEWEAAGERQLCAQLPRPRLGSNPARTLLLHPVLPDHRIALELGPTYDNIDCARDCNTIVSSINM